MSYTLKSNSPYDKCIQWSGLCMQYNGVTYEITDGYTNASYVYWTIDYPYNLVASQVYPELGIDDCLVFYNKNGIATVVPGATTLDGALIVPGTVLADAIAANAITGDKIAAGAITANTVAANAVGAAAIAAGAVSTDKLAAGSVSADKLAAGAVTANTVAANAIGAAAIAAGAISTDKLAAGAVTADKLTTNDIVGTNGRINLKKGTFDYGNGKLKWDGQSLSIEGIIRALSGLIGDWAIDKNGLKYEKTMQGAVGQIPFSETSGKTDCLLSFKPGTFQLDENSGYAQAKGSTILESVMTSYFPDGEEYVVYDGFRISNMGDFAFGTFDRDTDKYCSGVEYSRNTGEGHQGTFSVDCGSIFLRGYLYLSQITPFDDGYQTTYPIVMTADGAIKKTQPDTWHKATLSSRFELYGETTVKYKKVGDRVSISGVVKPKSVITGGTTSVPIFNLPSGYRPNFQRYFVCQGTGVNKWLMTVFTTGDVSISRYGTTSAMDIPTTAWLPFDVSFEI